jgi:stringent starvation protein B
MQARMWLQDLFLGEARFHGRCATSTTVTVPLAAVMAAAPAATGAGVLVHKQGPGRLYYRLGLKYAPRNPQQPPLSQGFLVERTVSRRGVGWF